VLTHIYVLIFFGHNAIITLKIYIVTETFLILAIFAEIVYSMPRPYWLSNTIVTNYCYGSFAFPGTTQITMLFFMFYVIYCIGNDVFLLRKK